MGGGTGRLPGRDVFHPVFKNCLYGRRDGMFAGTGRFSPRVGPVNRVGRLTGMS